MISDNNSPHGIGRVGDTMVFIAARSPPQPPASAAPSPLSIAPALFRRPSRILEMLCPHCFNSEKSEKLMRAAGAPAGKPIIMAPNCGRRSAADVQIGRVAYCMHGCVNSSICVDLVRFLFAINDNRFAD